LGFRSAKLHCTSLGSFVAAASVNAEQCRCRGPFRDLKIALMLMLPLATQQFRLEVASSLVSPQKYTQLGGFRCYFRSARRGRNRVRRRSRAPPLCPDRLRSRLPRLLRRQAPGVASARLAANPPDPVTASPLSPNPDSWRATFSSERARERERESARE